MALSIFKNRGVKAAQQQAKADYIKVASLPKEHRGARAVRQRMANRCKANLDKAFVEGAHKTDLFQKQSVAALTKGSEKPVAPVATSYQMVKTVSGEIYTYLPSEFAEEVFRLGAMYQTLQIDIAKAITLGQEIAARVSYDLGLDDAFVALQFLRDELAASVQTEAEAEAEENKDEDDLKDDDNSQDEH